VSAQHPDRLRVLALAARAPWPLDSGARLHLYHVLTELAQRAEVTLALPRAPRAGPASPTSDRQHADKLPPRVRVETIPGAPAPPGRSDPQQAAANGERRPARAAAPDIARRLVARHLGYDSAIDAWLRRAACPARFDVVLLNGAALGQYAWACAIPVVWNPQDELVLPAWREARYAGWRRWPPMLRRMALCAWFERRVARRAAATIYVSSVDAAYARRWAGGARIEVVQNGVDLDYFRPSTQPPEPGTVAFVGSLEFLPNADGITHFATRIWPRLYRDGRGRRLLIVGRRPVPAVRALAGMPGVELAADVPDVRPYLSRAAVVVVPVRTGGGLKNKILEACAVGRPVVAHPVALAGLSARIGRDVLAAGPAAEWVERVGRLLERAEEAQRIARRGGEWVRRTHSWAATGARFYEILASTQAPGTRPENGRAAGGAGRGSERPACLPARRTVCR